MLNIHRALLFSILFTVCFNAPIFYLKISVLDNVILSFISEMSIILPLTAILFYVFSLIPYLGTALIALTFSAGVISNIFIYNFKKSFDAGVLDDLLSVEIELVMEYANIYILTISAITLFLLCALIYKFYKVPCKKDIKTSSLWLAILFISIAIASSGFNRQKFNYTAANYLPFNVFYGINTYTKKLKKHSISSKKKVDLTSKYNFKIELQNNKEPLYIIMILGESMRGDFVNKETMPRLLARKNLVFFEHATSAASSTRDSIPYMLTSATPPNAEQSLGEKSVISIFNHMGFDTSWIANQGIFGVFESNFASIALEANHRILKEDLRKTFPDRNICDECLLPFLYQRLDQAKGKNLNFMVLHLIGSHWQFNERMPADFERKFSPYCANSLPGNCTQEELTNAYLNSFTYTDKIIDKILQAFEDKNALVIYASDHGISIGESGYFGNAHKAPDSLHQQHDIAMFAWVSESFAKNNPEKLKNIKKHLNSNVSHDYIFHSLLDCAGVKSEYIEDKLSVCSKP